MKKRLRNFLSYNCEYYFQYVLLTISIIYIIKRLIIPSFSVYPYLDYSTFEISDFLINYEGGFVRRGLLGQILHAAFSIHPFNIKKIILCTDIVCFFTFILIEIKIFLRRRWAFLPIVFPLLSISQITWYRRDFIMMIFIYEIFKLFISFLRFHSNKKLILSIILLNILLLIYEPAFFLSVPILILIFLFSEKNFCLKRIMQSVYIFATPITIMVFSCIHKTDYNQASAIWDSWRDLFVLFPEESNDIPKLGDGIVFLTYDSFEVIKMHWELLFDLENWPSFKTISSNIMLLSSIPMTYFLVSHVPTINTTKKRLEKNTSSTLLSNLFIVQTIVMSPLLFCLSCDFGRTFPTVISSTFLLCYFIEKENIAVIFPFITSISHKLEKIISENKFLNSSNTYFIIYCLIPLRAWSFPTFKDITIWKLLRCIKKYIFWFI